MLQGEYEVQDVATFSQLIKDLHARSRMTVKDYAEAINLSVTHLSNILNDQQPGSLKVLLSCLSQAGLNIQDCLELPDLRRDSERTTQLVKDILSRRDEYSKRLNDFIEDTARRVPAKFPRDKPNPVKREGDGTQRTGQRQDASASKNKSVG